MCMALAVLLAYLKAWLANGAVVGVLYLSYRNFATSVLLTALPMPFYLSLKHRGHLVTGGVMALALALTGSRSALLFGAVILALCGVYLMRHGVISRRCLTALAVAAGIAVLAAGPVVLQWVLHSRMGEDIQDSNSDRLQFLARAVDDFLRHPVFGIGLCSTRNADVFSGVEGSMVFYHNSVAQVMGSMRPVRAGAGRVVSGHGADFPVQSRRVLPLPQRCHDGDAVCSGGGGRGRRGCPCAAAAGASSGRSRRVPAVLKT